MRWGGEEAWAKPQSPALFHSPVPPSPRPAHRTPAGRPLVYISHGQHDRVLRIAYCSRRLVPHLEAAGYAVVYNEFDGPHTVRGPAWCCKPQGAGLLCA